MARKKTAADFEQSLGSLQALVERLESADLSLEESLSAFEQGVTLTRECQQALDFYKGIFNAEIKNVEKLLTLLSTSSSDLNVKDNEEITVCMVYLIYAKC